MGRLSTREVAKKLGISPIALSRYIASERIPSPEIVKTSNASLHLWSEEEIEHVRQLLPKIANGRKTRYKKTQSAIGTEQSAKGKSKNKNAEPQPGAAVPHKKSKPKQ